MFDYWSFTWLNHVYVLKASNHPQKFELNIFRHGVGDAIGVYEMRIKTFWFKPNGVSLLVPESFDLAFQRWTVPTKIISISLIDPSLYLKELPRSLDCLPDVDAHMKMIFDVLMHFWICPCLVTKNLLIL